MRVVYTGGDLVCICPAHRVGVPRIRPDVLKWRLGQLGHVRLPGHTVEDRNKHGARRHAVGVEQVVSDAAHEAEEHTVVDALVRPTVGGDHIVKGAPGAILIADAGVGDPGRLGLAADGAGALHVHGAVVGLDGRPGAPVVDGIIILHRLRDMLAALEIVHGAAVRERHGIDRLVSRVKHTVLRG